MPTTATLLPDSAFQPGGTVITASQVHVIYGGTPGLAVWEHPGQWYQTTPAALLANVHNTFGRLFPGYSLNTPIGNSNDTRAGEMDFHIKPDGGKVDTVTFSFVDVEDIPGGRKLPGGGTGTSFWFNGDRIDIRSDDQPGGHLPNNDLLVIQVKTTADVVHFRYDTGHSAAADGFAMLTCLKASEQPASATVLDLHHDAMLL